MRGLPGTCTPHPTTETCLILRRCWGTAGPSNFHSMRNILQQCSNPPVSHQSGRAIRLCNNLPRSLCLSNVCRHKKPTRASTLFSHNSPSFLHTPLPAFPNLSPFLCASDEFPALVKPLKATDCTSP